MLCPYLMITHWDLNKIPVRHCADCIFKCAFFDQERVRSYLKWLGIELAISDDQNNNGKGLWHRIASLDRIGLKATLILLQRKFSGNVPWWLLLGLIFSFKVIIFRYRCKSRYQERLQLYPTRGWAHLIAAFLPSSVYCWRKYTNQLPSLFLQPFNCRSRIYTELKLEHHAASRCPSSQPSADAMLTEKLLIFPSKYLTADDFYVIVQTRRRRSQWPMRSHEISGHFERGGLHPSRW